MLFFFETLRLGWNLFRFNNRSTNIISFNKVLFDTDKTQFTHACTHTHIFIHSYRAIWYKAIKLLTPYIRHEWRVGKSDSCTQLLMFYFWYENLATLPGYLSYQCQNMGVFDKRMTMCRVPVANWHSDPVMAKFASISQLQFPFQFIIKGSSRIKAEYWNLWAKI